jgi:hypothetical protein
MASLVDSRKEIIIAALMAVIVALGLGVASYSFFIGTPTPKTVESLLDLYTQKGGAGTNTSGGIFEPNDTAQLYAFLTHGGVPLNNATITYQINNAEGVQSTRTAFTNESGIADGNFSFLLSQDSSILGTWHILATAQVENRTVSDALSLLCQSESSQLNLHIRRNNQENTVFLPEDNVTLDAEVTFKNLPIKMVTTTFEVRTPNNTVFLTQITPTDSSGIATAIFQIPQNDSVGSWHATAQADAYGQPVTDAGTFECQLLSPIVDVYTQKGGYGPNQPSEPFAPYESVHIYAQVRDELNKSVPYAFIGFELRIGGNSQPRSAQTNGSGIAEINFTMSDSPFENYAVYATCEYNGALLLDTMTFKIAGILDVFTQQGGVGLRQDGGTFSLNETVVLIATVRDSTNQTVSRISVTFNVTSPDGAFPTEMAQTDLTGFASVTFTLPTDANYLGKWTVEASARYNDVVLSDVVAFVCQ